MNTKTDRRIRKTKTQLRTGLAQLMQEKSINEITVKELVEQVDINRSTFYLHYTDIYSMLHTLEDELMSDILNAVEEYPVTPFSEKSYPFLKAIFSILEENKELCCALLGPNGDIAFLEKIEQLLSQKCLDNLRQRFADNMEDVNYSYAFCLSGCIGLIKTWLIEGGSKSPQHMAELTFRFIMNLIKGNPWGEKESQCFELANFQN